MITVYLILPENCSSAFFIFSFSGLLTFLSDLLLQPFLLSSLSQAPSLQLLPHPSSQILPYYFLRSHVRARVYVQVYKYNLFSPFLVFVCICFQGWPLCVGQPIRRIILGEANSPSLNNLQLPVVPCPGIWPPEIPLSSCIIMCIDIARINCFTILVLGILQSYCHFFLMRHTKLLSHLCTISVRNESLGLEYFSFIIILFY